MDERLPRRQNRAKERTVAEHNPPNLFQLTGEADSALHRRNYQAAVKLYALALARPAIQPYLRAAILANLGLAWQYLDQFENATAALEQAVATNPKLGSAQAALGYVYSRQARHADALRHYELALRLNANDGITHLNRALSLEALGEIEASWQASEWRYTTPSASSFYPYRYTKPKWKGEPLQGRTLLIHREQGLGDVIQYLRFLPLLGRLGGRVRFECPAALLPLLVSFPGIEPIAARSHPVPEHMFDCYAPLLSLPHLLRFRVDDLAGTVPYLLQPTAMMSAHSTPTDHVKTIGFVWSGSAFDRSRNATLADFLPLLDMNARIVSLQKDMTDAEQRVLSQHDIGNAGSTFRHFGDTRDAMLGLDAIVSVDTAVAHLAGALAKPTWLIVNEPAAVRWMMDRSDSPWYPTMRIHRKPSGGHWRDALSGVVKSLKHGS